MKARVSTKIQSEVLFSKSDMATKTSKISIDDFDLIKVLGRGAFGKVSDGLREIGDDVREEGHEGAVRD